MSISTCGILAIAEETTDGVEAVGTYYSSAFTGSDFVPESNIIMGEENDGYQVTSVTLPGTYQMGGTINVLARPAGLLPRLFKGLLGNVSTTDLGGGAYQHDFSATTGCTETPSFTIYEDKLTAKFKTLGARFGGLDLSIGSGEKVTCAFSAMGLYNKEATAPSITTYNPRPMIWSDAAVTINGVADTTTENFSCSLSRDMEAVYTNNNQRYPSKIQNLMLSCSGSFVKEFSDMTQYRKFWGNVAATQVTNNLIREPIVYTFTSPDQIGASGQYYTLRLEFKSAIFSELSVPMEYNQRIIQNIGFICDRDTATNEFVNVRIINNEASI